jgi:hypothetical protein
MSGSPVEPLRQTELMGELDRRRPVVSVVLNQAVRAEFAVAGPRLEWCAFCIAEQVQQVVATAAGRGALARALVGAGAAPVSDGWAVEDELPLA